MHFTTSRINLPLNAFINQADNEIDLEKGEFVQTTFVNKQDKNLPLETLSCIHVFHYRIFQISNFSV